MESRRRAPAPTLAATGLVVVITVAAALLAQRVADREIDNRLALQSETLVAAVQSGVASVELRLVALEGLFRASETVTADEYADFVADLATAPGLGGMAYMPIVESLRLAAFQERVAEHRPGYEVFEIDGNGDRVPVQGRDVYFPVEFFESSRALEGPLGLDAGSPPGRLSYLLDAVDSDHTVATPLVELATTEQEGLVLYRPVRDTIGTVDAVVATPVVLDDLVADRVPRGLAHLLEWTIRDVTEQAPESTSPDPHVPILDPIGNGRVYTGVVAVADRIWQLDVTPAAGSPLVGSGRQPLGILFSGLIVAVLVGFGVDGYTRRREATGEMAALREVLEAKDSFLATVSHELRTPLTGVLGFAELLRDQDRGFSAAERAEMVATIAEEAADVAGIIDDLIVMGRAEHGTLTVAAVPVDVRAQIAQVLETLHLVGRIPVDETQTPLTAVGDPARVRQIIRNLVDNAVAYGGPNIETTIVSHAQQVVIEVADDGAGIPPEHADRVFDAYYRAHASTGTPGSMGLGLSVSRMLARRMGGDLTHHQTDVATIFRLVLPAATSAGDRPDRATEGHPQRTSMRGREARLPTGRTHESAVPTTAPR